MNKGLKNFELKLIELVEETLKRPLEKGEAAHSVLSSEQIKRIEHTLTKMIERGEIKDLKINHKSTPKVWVKNRISELFLSSPRLNGGKEKLSLSEMIFRIVVDVLGDLYDPGKPMREYFSGGTHGVFSKHSRYRLTDEDIKKKKRLEKAVQTLQDAILNDMVVIKNKDVNFKGLIIDRLNKDVRLNGGSIYKGKRESILERDPLLKRARFIVFQKEARLLKAKDKEKIKTLQKEIDDWLSFIGQREELLGNDLKKTSALQEALLSEDVNELLENYVHLFFKPSTEKSGIEKEMVVEKLITTIFDIHSKFVKRPYAKAKSRQRS